MNITPGYGNYEELKPIIGKYKKVLVTGPHGVENKITTDVIAHDFGLERLRGEYPWKLDEYETENGLITYHKGLQDREWAMFHHLTLVTFTGLKICSRMFWLCLCTKTLMRLRVILNEMNS